MTQARFLLPSLVPDEPERTDADRRPRTSTPPALPTDRVRMLVAIWHLAKGLGLTLDPSKPDHELLEQVSAGLNPKLASVFREGYACSRDRQEEAYEYKDPYGGERL